MHIYELSGETRYRIYKKYFYEAKSERDAIGQFKREKGSDIKKIKVTQIK